MRKNGEASVGMDRRDGIEGGMLWEARAIFPFRVNSLLAMSMELSKRFQQEVKIGEWSVSFR